MITWKILLLAIMQVESSGNPMAIGDSGQALGVLQIHSIYVQDVNQHLGTEYTHQDAYDPKKAILMFNGYMDRYATPERLGRAPTAMDIARIHNGGPNGHKKESTLKYWAKVHKQIQKIKTNHR